MDLEKSIWNISNKCRFMSTIVALVRLPAWWPGSNLMLPPSLFPVLLSALSKKMQNKINVSFGMFTAQSKTKLTSKELAATEADWCRLFSTSKAKKCTLTQPKKCRQVATEQETPQKLKQQMLSNVLTLIDWQLSTRCVRAFRGNMLHPKKNVVVFLDSLQQGGQNQKRDFDYTLKAAH